MKLSKAKREKLDKIRKRVLGFLFGQHCVCCGKIIELHLNLCPECAENLTENTEGCLKCGCPKNQCVCHEKRFEFSSLLSPYLYEGPAVDGIRQMKESVGAPSAEFFADKMIGIITHHSLQNSIDLIVSVPLTKRRKREKGYNQSDLIARRISRNLEIPFDPNAIEKVFETKPQHKCTAFQRTGNVFGVYEADYDLCHGKNILLVDDVTTGRTTLNECAKMLYIAGANQVVCVTAATAVLQKSKRTE